MVKNLKILIVEDSNYDRFLLEQGITKIFRKSIVMSARSYIEAVDLAQTNNFNVAIVDIDEVSPDSLRFLKMLTTDDPDIPLVVITSDNSDSVSQTIKKCGVDEVVYKDGSFNRIVPELVKKLIFQNILNKQMKRPEENRLEEEQNNILKITAGTLSHEINNPLMTILGMTELLLENSYEYDRELSKKIKIIQQSARRISDTLNKLTQISKPAIRNTASGDIIDTENSRLLIKSKV